MFTTLFQMVWGVAVLQPNFFSSGLILLAGLAQDSWRDLAAVGGLWGSLALLPICSKTNESWLYLFWPIGNAIHLVW
jgi:hypothetical protein